MQNFVQERGLTFTILLDEDSSVARDYKVRAIPSSFFIDREGVVQVRHAGALDGPLIDTYVEQVLR